MNLLKYIEQKCKNAITKWKRFLLIKQMDRSREKISTFKNKYAGQRCFIIGNGPSLKVEDLEKLKGEITFASHGIYYIYDKTDWRPTFYCAQDAKLILERYADIENFCDNSINFLGIAPFFCEYPKFKKNKILVELNLKPFENGFPEFSSDLSKCAYEGYTVTYFNIQLAIYMGFNEIYLLGVDHFYSGGEDDHFSEKDKCTCQPRTDLTTFSYIKANDYANENGVKIYNATRGGHLEVFERIDFDKVKGEK